MEKGDNEELKRVLRVDSRGPVVVRLMGGLGNQMFQYAFGRRIAEDGKVEVKYDIVSGFKCDAYGRRFSLDGLNLDVCAARAHEIPIGVRWTKPWNQVSKVMWSAAPKQWRRAVYDRAPYDFVPSIVRDISPSTYFFGYWQNERYFLPIKDVLREHCSLRLGHSVQGIALKKEIEGCRSISLHIRRNLGFDAEGRIVPKARDYYRNYDSDYYRKALRAIGYDKSSVCFVFADNPTWAKENLSLPVSCIFVADTGRYSDSEELLLMASCEHHVISNSSFGYWGAWLGSNPERIVVAPDEWANEVKNSEKGFCPNTWKMI
jgi:hypothetical protein